jgi:hypothetical protein
MHIISDQSAPLEFSQFFNNSKICTQLVKSEEKLFYNRVYELRITRRMGKQKALSLQQFSRILIYTMRLSQHKIFPHSYLHSLQHFHASSTAPPSI